MKVTLVCVGKLKESYWREACAEYEKRLSRYCKLEIRELQERRSPAEEAPFLLHACKGRVVALAVEGRERSSEKFALDISKSVGAGEEMTFLIGSSCGLDESVKARADDLLSFSPMTFPHQMMRVVFLEQLYRAFTILAGAEYHK